MASIALFSSTAWADDASPITTTAAQPSFPLMDPDGAANGMDVELGVTSVEDAQLWSQRVRGQVVGASGFGGYATLHGFLATGESFDADYGLANIEVGGLYHAKLGPSVDASARLGITLPTADHDLAPLIGMYSSRPSDVVLGAPEDFWARAGGSLAVHQGYVFARLDLGADQRVSGRGDKSDDLLLHVNAGLGVGTAVWSAVAQLQVLTAPNEDNSNAELVGVTAQYHGATMSPYLGVSLALDPPLEMDNAFTVTAGTRIPF